MFKRCVLISIIILASIALVCQPVTAKEDTAQIKLKKTAISKKNLYTYTVKEGDSILTIIRNIPSVTKKDISNNYQLIKELNPDIPNIDNLEVGQSIILPGKPLTETEENKRERPSVSPANIPVAKKVYYKIRRGDTLYKIIRRELKITETKIPQMVRTIKSINPSIKNVNKIYAGSIIKLPDKTVFVKISEEIKPLTQEMVSVLEKSGHPDKIFEVKEKKIMPPEARLSLLKQIITQMNGTITTTGNYYLPIPQSGQVTIDCSKIPVIEFDDNTIVFLDLENRAHNNLKKMISSNWKNYNLVKIDNDDDIFNILKKVLNATKNYDIIKSDKPLTIGSRPNAEILVEWLIVKPIPGKQVKSVVQGIRPIYENNLLLPKSIINYAQKNGLIITEFSDETGIVGKPEELYSLPPIPVFPTTSAKDFSYALVTNLGLSAEKDVDIQLFDTVTDGFNLSIKADVLVSNENKKYVIYSQPLSQQFTNALKQAGNETIFVSDSDSPKNIMDSVLSGLNIPFTNDNFVFSGPEKNQAPYALKFGGTKIYQDFYVVNFDMDSELRGLLQEVWSAKIARF
ncbi:MAG: LysM peptidoglycan-binding domain-containing protein [Syntrophaceae bacterium]|nr:LysM peptidoglycan-binding domain-containing protein [Syntrophaceae bacterium]